MSRRLAMIIKIEDDRREDEWNGWWEDDYWDGEWESIDYLEDEE